MKTAVELDRRAILSLIAMGRITPREAERLLAVSEDGDDAILKFAVVFAIAWIVLPQVHGVVHAVSMVTPRVAELAQSVVTCVTDAEVCDEREPETDSGDAGRGQGYRGRGRAAAGGAGAGTDDGGTGLQQCGQQRR